MSERTTKTIKLVIEVVNEHHREPDPRFRFPSMEEIAIDKVFSALSDMASKERSTRSRVYGDEHGAYCRLYDWKFYKPRVKEEEA